MPYENVQAIRAQMKTLGNVLKRKPERHLLFDYIVENTIVGNTDALTERNVAKQVFAETLAPGDQKASTVRTHASNLRAALAHYYFTDGCNDDVIIYIPPGGYIAKFAFRSTLAKQPVAPNPTAITLKEALPPLQTSRARCYLTLEFATIRDALSIEPTLQNVFGDQSLKVLAFRIGSLLVHIECSIAAYERMSKLLPEVGLQDDIFLLEQVREGTVNPVAVANLGAMTPATSSAPDFSIKGICSDEDGERAIQGNWMAAPRFFTPIVRFPYFHGYSFTVPVKMAKSGRFPKHTPEMLHISLSHSPDGISWAEVSPQNRSIGGAAIDHFSISVLRATRTTPLYVQIEVLLYVPKGTFYLPSLDNLTGVDFDFGEGPTVEVAFDFPKE